jgi:hypothetical protein
MFVMLDCALRYRKALDALSGKRSNKLRDFELKEEEWRLIQQLRDVLKVRASKHVNGAETRSRSTLILSHLPTGVPRRNSIFGARPISPQ